MKVNAPVALLWSVLAGCAASSGQRSGAVEPSSAAQTSAADTGGCGEATDAQLSRMLQRQQVSEEAPPSQEEAAEGVSLDEASAAPEAEGLEVAPEPSCTLTDESYAAGFARQLGEVEASLEQLTDGGDCDRICHLSQQVCSLSERICGLRDRNPGSPSIRERCEDGRARCEEAERRAGERCNC